MQTARIQSTSRSCPSCRPAQRARVVLARLKAGDSIPDISVTTDTGTTLTTKDLIKANTSGCTTQASGFRDNAAALATKGYKIYGISADSPADQASWKAQYKFGYPLLCDDSKLTALNKLGLADGTAIKRSHLVVAKGGKVVDVQIGVSSKDSVPKALEVIMSAKAI